MDLFGTPTVGRWVRHWRWGNAGPWRRLCQCLSKRAYAVVYSGPWLCCALVANDWLHSGATVLDLPERARQSTKGSARRSLVELTLTTDIVVRATIHEVRVPLEKRQKVRLWVGFSLSGWVGSGSKAHLGLIAPEFRELSVPPYM